MLRGLISYWMIPLFSGVVWLAMLLAMLIYWLTTGKPIYSEEAARGDKNSNGETIPYISDVGADKLKPLFIAMGTVSVVTFDIVFIAERWLRHRGRLVTNTHTSQKILSGFAIVFAIAGALGLILLTIFDTKRHPNLHDGFLGLFIGGYVISAVFICAEYQRLGIKFRQFRILRMSFWIKLFFILVEVALAIAFGVTGYYHHYNSAAVIEWVIALVYAFYVASFIIDFLPATRKRHYDHEEPMTMDQMATNGNANDMAYGYNSDRSLGQAVRDTRDSTRADHHKIENGHSRF